MIIIWISQVTKSLPVRSGLLNLKRWKTIFPVFWRLDNFCSSCFISNHLRPGFIKLVTKKSYLIPVEVADFISLKYVSSVYSFEPYLIWRYKQFYCNEILWSVDIQWTGQKVSCFCENGGLFTVLINSSPGPCPEPDNCSWQFLKNIVIFEGVMTFFFVTAFIQALGPIRV